MFSIERLRKQVVPGSTGHLIWAGTLVACLLTISLAGCTEAKATPNAKACEVLNFEADVRNGNNGVALDGSLDSVLASKGITSELAAVATDYWKAHEEWETSRQNLAGLGFGIGNESLNALGDVEKAQKAAKLAARAIMVQCKAAGVAATGSIKEDSDAYDEVFNKG
jgi:hypothetical protein